MTLASLPATGMEIVEEPQSRQGTVGERVASGREARKRAPRSELGEWQPAPGRADPVTLLEEQGRTRLQDLLPVRYGRMLESPFAFLRGSAAVMARDLASTPDTGLIVQLCGDAHLANFGLFASPERRLIFGINDFDETAPGPFEWDVKRLAASVAVVGRALGLRSVQQQAAARQVGVSYQQAIQSFAAMRELDIWYMKIEETDILAGAKTQELRFRAVKAVLQQAHSRDSLKALKRLTAVVEGHRVITKDPPLIVDASAEEHDYAHQAFRDYLETVSPERRVLLRRYHVADVARKVVGVGSVGTRCWIALLTGRDEADPLFLQIKEASRSVIEVERGRDEFQNQGQRVVIGQRMCQAVSDIFLGWIRGPGGRDFYWRQLWDMKGGFDPLLMTPEGLQAYAGACAVELARAHARTGDAVAIAAYVGNSTRFADALRRFADAYADQTQRDFEALQAAEKRGAIAVMRGR